MSDCIIFHIIDIACDRRHRTIVRQIYIPIIFTAHFLLSSRNLLSPILLYFTFYLFTFFSSYVKSYSIPTNVNYQRECLIPRINDRLSFINEYNRIVTGKLIIKRNVQSHPLCNVICSVISCFE